MRWFTWILIILAVAAPVWAQDAPREISLAPGGEVGKPAGEDPRSGRAGGLTLELAIPSLEATEVEIDGRAFQELADSRRRLRGRHRPRGLADLHAPGGVAGGRRRAGRADRQADGRRCRRWTSRPVQPVVDAGRGQGRARGSTPRGMRARRAPSRR